MNYKKTHLLFWIMIMVSMSIVSSCEDNEVEDTPTTNEEGDDDESENHSTTTHYVNSARYDNEKDLLAKTFLITKWIDYTALVDMAPDEIRSALIGQLEERSQETATSLGLSSDQELTWHVLMYRFIHKAGLLSSDDLSNMSFDDWRNTIIVENAANTDYTIEELQGFNDKKNLFIAYEWWLHEAFSEEIAALEDVTGDNVYHRLHDDNNKTMDVLRVLRVDKSDFKFVGVYHSWNNSTEVFDLHLAGSNDLENWQHITTFGGDMHQGDIEQWGDGYLLANEGTNSSGNYIEIRFFPSYTALKNNHPSDHSRISREFSPYAEGTPDIRKMEGESPENSKILIGFHYYKNGDVDEPAIGVLENFNSWRAWTDEISHYNIRNGLGATGNIGGRAQFELEQNDLGLQEVMMSKDDWSTWAIFFSIDGAFYHELNFNTEKNSTSFANPGIAETGTNAYAVTSFMPSEGNDSNESGQLLYEIQF